MNTVQVTLTKEEIHVIKAVLEMSQEMMFDSWHDMKLEDLMTASQVDRNIMALGMSLGKISLANAIVT